MPDEPTWSGVTVIDVAKGRVEPMPSSATRFAAVQALERALEDEGGTVISDCGPTCVCLFDVPVFQLADFELITLYADFKMTPDRSKPSVFTRYRTSYKALKAERKTGGKCAEELAAAVPATFAEIAAFIDDALMDKASISCDLTKNTSEISEVQWRNGHRTLSIANTEHGTVSSFSWTAPEADGRHSGQLCGERSTTLTRGAAHLLAEEAQRFFLGEVDHLTIPTPPDDSSRSGR